MEKDVQDHFNRDSVTDLVHNFCRSELLNSLEDRHMAK